MDSYFVSDMLEDGRAKEAIIWDDNGSGFQTVVQGPPVVLEGVPGGAQPNGPLQIFNR